MGTPASLFLLAEVTKDQEKLCFPLSLMHIGEEEVFSAENKNWEGVGSGGGKGTPPTHKKKTPPH